MSWNWTLEGTLWYPNQDCHPHITGSAHCTLGPYWKSVLHKSPDTRLVGRQVGPKRQGTVRVRCVDEETVEISGHAVIVSKTIFYPSIFD